jgi:chromate transporter
LFFFGAPFPLIVLGAALVGLALGARLEPARGTSAEAKGGGSAVDVLLARGQLDHTRPSLWRSLRALLVAAIAWASPILLLAWWLGPSARPVQAGLFFSKAAVVTFGGAYAVLAYVAERAVQHYQWLSAGEMLDSLGLAETTPGPLILVLELVGFLGAYGAPGPLHPIAAGAIGAGITVWVTFVPCFLWIFLGAPYIEHLRGRAALDGALSAITAAVVGVILNLSLWFALHVLFGHVVEARVGSIRLLSPELASLDLRSLALAVIASICLFALRLGMGKTMLLSAVLGAGLRSWWPG